MNWIGEPPTSRASPATDILLDGMRIHDFTKHNSGAHVDCIGIDNVNGIIDPEHAHLDLRPLLDHLRERLQRIRRSRTFSSRTTSSIAAIRPEAGIYSIGFGGVDGPVMIRFNSMTLGMGWLNANGDLVTNDRDRLQRHLQQLLPELLEGRVALQSSPIRSARCWLPSARVTSSRSASWTTWLLVRMYPLEVKTNPEPVPRFDRPRPDRGNRASM